MVSGGVARRGRLSAWWERVAPEPGPQRALVASSFVNRLGSGMFIAASALYFTLIVGIPARQVGVGLTVAGAAALGVSVPAGMLADRVGPRTVQLVTLAVQAATMTAFVVVHSWWVFTVVAALDRIADTANNAARGTLIARVGGERPALFRAKLRSFVSLAVILGTPLAGVAIQIGTRAAYVTLILVNAATYVVCGLLLLRVPEYPPIPRPPGARRFAALADRPYAALAALNGVLNLQAVVVALVIPLWITTRTQVPHAAAAAVFGLNFAGSVLLMQPVGRRMQDVATGGRALRTAGLTVALGCAVLAASGAGPRWTQTAVLLAGSAAVCAAGVWATAAGFSLGFELAPAHAQGEYQGLMLLGLDAAAAVGPALLTALVLGAGGGGWCLLGAGFAAAGLLGPRITGWAERTRPAVGEGTSEAGDGTGAEGTPGTGADTGNPPAPLPARG